MEKELTIYYTSDIHGCFSPIDYATGLPADSGLANCMAQFRKDGNTLVIDGGDTLQGSPLTYYLSHEARDVTTLPAALLNLLQDFRALVQQYYSHAEKKSYIVHD